MPIEPWLLAALILAGAAFLLAVFCTFKIIALKSLLNSRLEDFNLLNEQLQAINEETQMRVEENHAALMTVHKSVSPIASKIETIEGKLREQEPNDPQIKLYQSATNMAKKGISAGEIASSCDLPLAEAEMLKRLYENKEV